MRRLTSPLSLSVALAVAVLGGCASQPPQSLGEIARLQNELTRLRHDPQVGPFAQVELQDAHVAVELLAAEAHEFDRESLDQGLYIAGRLIAIAEAEGRARHAEQRALALHDERERMLADARRREVEAQRLARSAAEAEAAAARAAVAAARSEANAARSALQDMQLQLAALKTRQTERGLTVTLDDVLFETGRAELKAGAARSLDQLAAALRANPQATISIEGHTDAVGSRSFNLELSADRAAAVRDHLLRQGIEPERISARGFGPDYPVASNADVAGRQQNRRVEVVIVESAGS